jgi:hypothetical protein
MVAALPVAWMYSLLSLMPIAVVSLRRRSTIATGAVIVSIALCVGSPPLDMWPVPVVVALSAVALTGIVETEFWPDGSRLVRYLETARAWPANTLATVRRPHPSTSSRVHSED